MIGIGSEQVPEDTESCANLGMFGRTPAATHLGELFFPDGSHDGVVGARVIKHFLSLGRNANHLLHLRSATKASQSAKRELWILLRVETTI